MTIITIPVILTDFSQVYWCLQFLFCDSDNVHDVQCDPNNAPVNQIDHWGASGHAGDASDLILAKYEGGCQWSHVLNSTIGFWHLSGLQSSWVKNRELGLRIYKFQISYCVFILQPFWSSGNVCRRCMKMACFVSMFLCMIRNFGSGLFWAQKNFGLRNIKGDMLD